MNTPAGSPMQQPTQALDDRTHAVCEVDAQSLPILAICGVDCTSARVGSDLPYCELCVALLTAHLARCEPCFTEFRRHAR